MPEADTGIVRLPISIGHSSRRRLVERVGLRLPGLIALIARLVWRRGPHSAVRNALLRRLVRLGCEANNRGDTEAALLLYHPQVEATMPPELAVLGIDAHVSGREARVRLQERWREEWGVFRINPTEVLVSGDRVALLVSFETAGLSSGAAADAEGAFVFTVSDGLAILEQVFLDRDAAIEAAGFRD